MQCGHSCDSQIAWPAAGWTDAGTPPHPTTHRVRTQSTPALPLEVSARVLRLEGAVAKQQQALDTTARQADKAAIAGRLYRHDMKQPFSQVGGALAWVGLPL